MCDLVVCEKFGDFGKREREREPGESLGNYRKLGDFGKERERECLENH